MLNGKQGEAYNIANTESITSIADLAKLIANIANIKIIFDKPTKTEKQGFSKIKQAILCNQKLRNLGLTPLYSLYNGIEKTIHILLDGTNM